MRIRGDGSNGFVGTTWGDGALMICAKSSAGERCDGISRRLRKIVAAAISVADPGNGRRCCTGPMTRERCDEMSLSQTERDQLLQAATKVAGNARAKYSGFRVGAAVLGDRGTYLGVNVENASYGLAICAERAALAAAVTAGEKNIRAIAIVCLDSTTDETKMPCGACRQWILELAPTAEILINGRKTPLRIDELLPHPFKADA